LVTVVGGLAMSIAIAIIYSAAAFTGIMLWR
jgi:hypothetical protein